MAPELEGSEQLVTFWANVHEWGVQQRVLAFQQTTPPLPAPIQFHRFSVGLIDGGHRYNQPSMDFELLNPLLTNYLLFDNTEKEGVKKAVKLALRKGWRMDNEVTYDCGVPNYGDITMVALARE